MRTSKLLSCIAAALTAFTASAWQAPTVNPQVTGPPWIRTGNVAAPNNGNVLGTFFSSPFYLYTDNFLRMRVNDNFSSSVNTLPAIPRNGYIGIGTDLNFWSQQNPGPFTLLHLNGPGGGQQFGYRNWMQTGITLTSNQDLAYIGHKANSLDVTDLVFAWSDNDTGQFGPDILKFVFTSNTGIGNNDLNGDHPDGREIMRLTGFGNVGIGPRFTNAATAQPQSMLHLNAPNAVDATLQLTSQNSGQLATDGLLLRVLGASRDAWISQQEDAPLILLTGTNAGNGGERMRVTNVGPNTQALPQNLTRVGIRHQPGSMTAPRSVLHLGTNLGSSLNGWRPWMDIGTLTTVTSDHLYVGLKAEPPNFGSLGDRQDAVIAWGDNGNPAFTPTGPDYLRFIFTSATADTWDAAAKSPNGKEILRLTPKGQAGIGDWPNITPFIDATLDIAGDLRIRNIPQDPTLTHVLVADQNDQNRVHWRDASTLGAMQFFSCGTSVAADKLPSNAWWELNNFNFVFAGQGGTSNTVGIGTTCTPGAKLHVNRQFVAPAMFNPIGVRVDHGDISQPGPLLGMATGVLSTINGDNRLNIAGDFAARNARQNIAVRGVSTFSQFTNIGGWFSASGAQANYGVYATAPAVANSWAGYFNGHVHVTGTFTNSDRRIKRNIEPIGKALDTINRLQPRTYFFNAEAEPRLSLPRERQYGVIAQDVEKVLPELVSEVTLPAVEENERPATVKSVNYDAFIAILIAGMQEQQREIAALRTRVDELSKRK
jgi:Chaperone of endosialidase